MIVDVMKRFYWGAFVGITATGGCLLWSLGSETPDAFNIGLIIFVSAMGGVMGGAVVLAWIHVTRTPRVLIPTSVCLIVLSVLPATCYEREKSHTPEFLAASDSMQGVVEGRNLFGNLTIKYRWDSTHFARHLASRKRAHNRLSPGDSIWLYRGRAEPHHIDEWPAGPDLAVTIQDLLWLWLVGGMLIAGYGPLLRRRPAKAEAATS